MTLNTKLMPVLGWCMTKQAVLPNPHFSSMGLTEEKAAKLIVKYGTNTIPESKPPSSIKLIFRQLKSPLVYILLVSSCITFVLGDYADTIIILIAVFINTILGFVQEKKADNALDSLKQVLESNARVIRNGLPKYINSEQIVPGDICIINQGDKLTADGVLLESNRLYINESILTGESMPVEKTSKHNVFMGTTVTSGNGQFLVLHTGAQTEFGKIAIEVQRPEQLTPLGEKLKVLSKQLSVLVLVLVSMVFVLGIITNKPIEEVFTTSVALAVSAIPEGLLVALTVVLAIGMQRILKRNGLVRNLVSAETLGSVTTICIDKTGTITKGEMELVDYDGSKTDIVKQLLLANDRDEPMTIAAHSWALKQKGDVYGNTTKLDSVPFDPKERFSAHLISQSNQKTLYVNGAPDHLLTWTTLSRKQISEVQADIDRHTRDGKRVIGLAKKSVSVKTITTDLVKSDLEWVGFVVFSDPPRVDVREVFGKIRKAGIKLIVITGDYPQTTVSILKKVGIDAKLSEVLTGKYLSSVSESDLSKKLKENSDYIKVFARTTPEQKLKIVRALKLNGEIVAMMGDGVNDAPALKEADIGVVVGNASDVAKDSSDLVLIDSNFETILYAVEEGRGLFDNLRKIILYLLSGAFSEITTVTGSLILGVSLFPGLPISVLAGQILWINLVSDGLPHLALTVDPKSEKILRIPPRTPKEALVSNWMKVMIMAVSLFTGMVALAVFVLYYLRTDDVTLSHSMAFAILGASSLVYVFSIRTLTKPFWRENPFSNKWLNMAVVGGFVLQIFPFMFPVTRNALQITQLSVSQWGLVIGMSFVVFFIIEMFKVVIRLDRRMV